MCELGNNVINRIYEARIDEITIKKPNPASPRYWNVFICWRSKKIYRGVYALKCFPTAEICSWTHKREITTSVWLEIIRTAPNLTFFFFWLVFSFWRCISESSYSKVSTSVKKNVQRTIILLHDVQQKNKKPHNQGPWIFLKSLAGAWSVQTFCVRAVQNWPTLCWAELGIAKMEKCSNLGKQTETQWHTECVGVAKA